MTYMTAYLRQHRWLFVSSMLFASLALIATYALHVRAGAGSSDPILEINNETLTSYNYTGPTPSQDVYPRAEDRGTGIDGTLRVRPALPMAINGNPFERGFKATTTPIRESNGTTPMHEVDLRLPSKGFSWEISRSFNGRQYDSYGSSDHDSNGYQGNNWFQNSQPELLPCIRDDCEIDIIYIVYGANAYLEYARLESTDRFEGVNGAAGIIEYKAGTPDLYILTDQHSNEITFFGYDTSGNRANGQLWKMENPDGDVAYVGHETNASSAVTSGYYTHGGIDTAYDTDGRRYTYNYSSAMIGGAKRLEEIVVEHKPVSTWIEIASVAYSYHDGTTSRGSAGDLEMATVTKTTAGSDDVRKKHYRYWKGTYNSSTNPGHDHNLKLVVDFEGCRSHDLDETGTGEPELDDGFLTETLANLEPFARAYYEYDASRRVDEAWFSGQCGCGGAGTGTYAFEYVTHGTGGTGYDTDWRHRTLVTKPDGGYEVHYYDETHEHLSWVLTDATPKGTHNAWATYVIRDSYGCVDAIHTPANITGYTYSTDGVTDSFTASTSAGLVHCLERCTIGKCRSFLEHQKWQDGTSGSKYFVTSYTYDSKTLEIGSSTGHWVPRPFVKTIRRYPDEITSGTTGSFLTTITTTVHSSTLATKEITIDEPSVATGENGSGSVVTRKQHLNKDGTIQFTCNTEGTIGYREYTGGQLTKSIQDVDTSHGDLSGVTIPTGFTSSGTEFHWVTTYAYDDMGRRESMVSPDGKTEEWYYSVLNPNGLLVTLSYPHVSGSTFYGPVGYSVTNHAGRPEVEATVTVSGGTTTTAQSSHIDETDGDPIDAVSSLGGVVHITETIYDEPGTRVEEVRTYFDTPTSLSSGTTSDYDATTYGYDDMGRQIRTEEPHGTITTVTYDVTGKITHRYMGTDDTGGGGDDMVLIESLEYDNGSTGGNRFLTERTLPVDTSSSNDRVTEYEHDARGRVLIVTNPDAPHAMYFYDNLGRRLSVGQYTTAPSTPGDPGSVTTNRVALSDTHFDDRGRVWKTVRHKIDPADGSSDDTLEDKRWYDSEGRLAKQKGQVLRKCAYDRLGRKTNEYILAKDNDSAYADMLTITGDTVLEEIQTGFADASQEVLMQAKISRHHDDYGMSETTGALDTNTDPLILTTSARPQIMAFWHDDLNRETDRVNYGTYGGSTFNRSTIGSTIPNRSTTELRTSTVYDDAGRLESNEDPKSLVNYQEYDDAGRITKQVANYDSGFNGGAPSSGSDKNKTTEMAYTDGLQVSLTAVMPSALDNQVTTYTYGTTLGTTTGTSRVATGHLLSTVAYPDSTGASDDVDMTYNRQGQEIWREDQSGNDLETTYDYLGRIKAVEVTDLQDGDSEVVKIQRSYSNRGFLAEVTQCDSTSELDSVEFTYDEWGLIEKIEQDNDSAVGASPVNDYEISYTYEKATDGRATIRRKTATLPSGTATTFVYASTTYDDKASRVSSLKRATTTVAEYEYLGFAVPVGVRYPEPDLDYRRYGSGGAYDHLDRFNRVITDQWKNTTSDAAFYDTDWGYDENSNVTYQDGHVYGDYFDAAYSMDGLDRLNGVSEGEWGGSSITTEVRAEDWGLDYVGNWSEYDLDLPGTDNDLDEERTHNKANEIGERDTNSSAPAEFSLSCDARGNLTDDDEDYKYEYDPWNRLRFVKKSSNSALIAEIRYNGLGHAIAIHEDTDGDNDVDGSDEWRHNVFDERWRLVATFMGTDTDPTEEFVFNDGGTGEAQGRNDAVVLRKRDTDDNGTLDEGVYYAHNWRGDVVALVDDGGVWLESVRYSAYGVPHNIPAGDMDGDWDVDSSDETEIQAIITAAGYEVEADLNLDGDVTSADKTIAQGAHTGALVLGRDVLSSAWGSRKGYAGYEHLAVGLDSARFRVYQTGLGRWIQRDPNGYVDGLSIYAFVKSNPVWLLDPFGLQSRCSGECRYLCTLSFTSYNDLGSASGISSGIHHLWVYGDYTCDLTGDTCGAVGWNEACYCPQLFSIRKKVGEGNYVSDNSGGWAFYPSGGYTNEPVAPQTVGEVRNCTHVPNVGEVWDLFYNEGFREFDVPRRRR